MTFFFWYKLGQRCFDIVVTFECSPRQEAHKNNTFFIPKTITTVFPVDGAHASIYSLGMSCGATSSISAWIWLQNGEPRFHPT